ncbi:MAG: class I SAM-dependent rRNA methyltransferase [Planctomycetales bacterium]|nr:class I SAM-dependent rRNA methyltransferase [Planctomycetales bacterium]
MATVVLRKGKVKPAWLRHPWVYAASVAKIRGDPKPGDLVEVEDPNGEFIGRGYYNPRSTIAVRLLTWQPEEEVDSRFFRRRIAQASALRQSLSIPKGTSAFRLVHSEGDGLPGLVVDRYADHLVVQLSALGMDRQADAILDALEEVFSPAGIYGRPDAHACELEGIPGRAGVLRGKPPPEEVLVEEHGLKFAVDVVAGQKTGFFCDQRENRARVGELAAKRRVMDCFAYTGAFALHAARGGAREVFAFESSPEALKLAGRNRELNGTPNITILQGEVFWELQNLVNRGERFDLLVLDPPKFVRDRDTLEKGVQGYKVLNTLGIALLTEGGLLVTCSCSGLVDEETFERTLMGAAIEAGREIQVVERRSQPGDHPVVPACPESRYLKCYVCLVT